MKRKETAVTPMQSYANDRIYCVVADTVQTPLQTELVQSHVHPDTTTCIEKLVFTEETISVVQPAGRLIAQAAHAVSRVRDYMLKQYLKTELAKPGVVQRLKKTDLFWGSYCPEITTIVLSARNSYELFHVYNLLHHFRIPVHPFFDYNQPDYGDVNRRVMTAIATEPVNPDTVSGILDYLPLWKPRRETV